MVTQQSTKKRKRPASKGSLASTKKQKKNTRSGVNLHSDYVVFFFRSLFQFLYGFVVCSLLFFLVLLFMLLVESSFGVSLVPFIFLEMIALFFLMSVAFFLIPEIVFMCNVYHRSYRFTSTKITFIVGFFRHRKESIMIDDIERIEIERTSFSDILFNTNTIVIRTNRSVYDPLLIPCVRNAHQIYIEMEKILSD